MLSKKVKHPNPKYARITQLSLATDANLFPMGSSKKGEKCLIQTEQINGYPVEISLNKSS